MHIGYKEHSLNEPAVYKDQFYPGKIISYLTRVIFGRM